jgi:integrin beta 3
MVCNPQVSPPFAECSSTVRGTDYVGTQTMTSSGRICQQWARQVPHAHHYTNDREFPDRTVTRASNYCRNPDKRAAGQWCYTQDPGVEWEACNIPLCQGKMAYVFGAHENKQRGCGL